MSLKEKVVYYLFIVVCISICLGLSYQIVEASVVDWLLGGTKTIVVEMPPVKTLNGEINRLSELYKVSSSTVRAVAKCESSLYGSANNKNFDENGNVWSTDFGYLQVNDYFHEQTMAKLGMDIHNEWDSLEYGIRMMSEQGLTPWKASSKCWSKLI